jgi:hypothetical protein
LRSYVPLNLNVALNKDSVKPIKGLTDGLNREHFKIVPDWYMEKLSV